MTGIFKKKQFKFFKNLSDTINNYPNIESQLFKKIKKFPELIFKFNTLNKLNQTCWRQMFTNALFLLIVVKKTATIPEGTEIINLLSTDVDFSYSIFANLFPLFFSLFSY